MRESETLRSKSDVNWSVDSRGTEALSARRPAPLGNSSLGTPDSVIAANCVINGDLKLAGMTRIDGQVEGEITTEGELIVGESAAIKANILGKVVIVLGRVEGHIKCTERLELHAGAHVTGDVLSPRVMMEDGVLFEGRCWMAEQRKSAEARETQS